MNIILFDEPLIRQRLLPLTFTRPVAAIRTGILTIAQKWKHYSGTPVSYLTAPYLQQKYPVLHAAGAAEDYYINGALLPTPNLLEEIRILQPEQALYDGDTLLALKGGVVHTLQELIQKANLAQQQQTKSESILVRDVWDIFVLNGEQIRCDFKLVTAGRQSQPLNDKYTAVYNEENIFLEEGAKVTAAVLNAEDGPIYIGKNAQVQEGAMIRGPFALCEGSHVSMGAKIRGDTTIGPFSKVGGEISNSVIFGYTSKGHDGFLGNSVLGEWCNLGADTNTSNLKNNYADVKVWSYVANSLQSTGRQFCGLIMGDHSKCGITTMFNTGTVVGVSANIFGSGYPRNFIPSFSWGGSSGFSTYRLPKAYEVASKVLERRNYVLDETEKAILAAVFEQTQQYRTWDEEKEAADHLK